MPESESEQDTSLSISACCTSRIQLMMYVEVFMKENAYPLRRGLCKEPASISTPLQSVDNKGDFNPARSLLPLPWPQSGRAFVSRCSRELERERKVRYPNRNKHRLHVFFVRTSKEATASRTGFGAPSEIDGLSTPDIIAHSTYSNAISMRELSPDHLPSLASLCARAFASNIRQLYSDQASWEVAREWLRALPDETFPRLLSTLRAICPTLLSHDSLLLYACHAYDRIFSHICLQHFLRGSSITLTRELPWVNKFTIDGVGRTGTSLTELYLIGFSNFPMPCSRPSFGGTLSKSFSCSGTSLPLIQSNIPDTESIEAVRKSASRQWNKLRSTVPTLCD